MSTIAQFLRPGQFKGEQILDKAAFRKFAAEHSVKQQSRTIEDDRKAVDGINRLLSSSAGVAELQNIEGDFEVLNIHRDSIPMDFAEMRNLPLGEIPIYRTRSLNPVGIFAGALSGVGSYNYYATKDSGVQVYPFTYSTEKVMLPNLNNIYDMEKMQQRKHGLERLDEYLQIGANNIALNTLLAWSGSNSVITDDPAVSLAGYAADGGSFSGKTVYTLDPGVIAASVPSVNYYALGSEEGLTKKVFRTVNTHSIQIGRRMVKMYIPTAALSGQAPVWESLQNLATPVALVAGQGNQNPAAAIPSEMWSQFQKEDFRGEVVIDWFGLKIAVSKQNWMPAGYALVFSDEPGIVMWDRLTLSSGAPEEGTLDTPVDGFYSYRSKARNIATARPDFMLRNFMVLQIQA